MAYTIVESFFRIVFAVLECVRTIALEYPIATLCVAGFAILVYIGRK